MQYHLNCVRTGDPSIAEAAPARPKDKVDVLIVGCGPAGLTLAAQMAAFPDINTRIIEAKDGPLQMGQADGVAVRTVEMFQSFGFADRAMREAYWVSETAFWKPDPANPTAIARADRIDDVEEGLGEFPHLILSQARIHDFYLEIMERSALRLTPDYETRFLAYEKTSDPEFPVTCHLAGPEGEETVRTRYLIGCDGARSAVRTAMDLPLKGDSANKAWGVMDVLCVTDFPDIRLKAVLQSAEGAGLIIPREGGYMVRFYIEMEKLKADERVSDRDLTAEDLIAAARRILSPYTLEVKEVAWWSVYEIGQRLCERFDDGPDPRVFIAGDACHTHSPKAGQGMNVGTGDAFNLGWKLTAVLRGQARHELLETYSAERQALAQELIDFDRDFASAFATKDDAGNAEAFQAIFQKHGRFTAGTSVTYAPSIITGDDSHQVLAAGFPVGMRFHSAPVIRLGDAKPMHLGHAAEADGRWRVYGFDNGSDWVGGAADAIAPFTLGDPDEVIDLRAIFQMPHRDMDFGALHPALRPVKGRYGLTDYEKAFCPDPSADIFDMRGVNRERGALVVVRPDQYVAAVLPLDGDLRGFLAQTLVALYANQAFAAVATHRTLA
ncbi:MAG: FAD-dependent monooxygenase [Pseudomonadota bacterium]